MKRAAVLFLIGLALIGLLALYPADGAPRASSLEMSPASFMPLVNAPPPTATLTDTPTATPTASETATPTATSTASATATFTPSPTVPGTPVGANVVCSQSGPAQICVWVSNAFPSQNSIETVYGRLLVNTVGQSGQTMDTTWHYKTVTSACSGTTGSDGVASCSRDISRATLGFQVNIDVNINGFQATTWFTPQ